MGTGVAAWGGGCDAEEGKATAKGGRVAVGVAEHVEQAVAGGTESPIVSCP